jgi:hypothetical protein
LAELDALKREQQADGARIKQEVRRGAARRGAARQGPTGMARRGGCRCR